MHAKPTPGESPAELLTRKQFLKTLGAAAVSGVAMAVLPGRAETVKSEPAAPAAKDAPPVAVPSYLKCHEEQYHKDPRDAALEWHRNAKWGMFVHYALASLRGLTAQQSVKARAESGTGWKKLKQGTPEEFAKLKERFTAEKFDADSSPTSHWRRR